MTLWQFALVAGAFLFVAAGPTPAGGGEWIEDMAKAREKAKAEGKDLLMNFTGSDWCVWCKRLDSEVFTQKAFQTEIDKHFILVKLDYPKDPSLVTDEIRKQNEKLQQEYAVEGYPSIILADVEGRPYAQTGYQQGGAEAYLAHVAELRANKAARDKHFEAAGKAEGIERARHLDRALDAIGEDLAGRHYKAEIAQILELDTGNEAGLKAEYEALLKKFELKAVMRELDVAISVRAEKGEWDEFIVDMDKVIKDHEGETEVIQMATFYKAVAYIETQRFGKGIELMEAAKKLDEKSEVAGRLEVIIPQVKKMKEELDKKKAGGGGK